MEPKKLSDATEYVRILLGKSRLPASEAEIQELARSFVSQETVEALYSVASGEIPPIVRFILAEPEAVDDSRSPGGNEPSHVPDSDQERHEGVNPRTIFDAGQALRRREVSSFDLTMECLERAHELDADLGVYINRFDEQALDAARHADRELTSGKDRGMLHGIPVAIKDIIATLEGPTTAQSLVIDPEWGRGTDAPVVARLRENGAVILGKTTTNEFALGLPDPEKPFPIPRNPWNLSRWTGGSSAGSASGLAAGLFLGALGTDTGGSIRMPAAFCGVSGLKPTFGLVPKSGCVPLGFTLDCIGPMARSAQDCALILDVIAGWDPTDPDSIQVKHVQYSRDLDRPIKGLRLGVEPERYFGPESDPGLQEVFENAVAAFTDAGAELVDVSLRTFEALDTATWLVMLSEGLAYHRQNLTKRWNDYGASTRMALATAAGYSAADYIQAQRVRSAAKREVDEIFNDCDVILTPTVGAAAPPVNVDIAKLATLLFTPVWSGVGLPAISIPMGSDAEGMPLGLQIVGRQFDESRVLNVAHVYQQQTKWHMESPSLRGRRVAG